MEHEEEGAGQRKQGWGVFFNLVFVTEIRQKCLKAKFNCSSKLRGKDDEKPATSTVGNSTEVVCRLKCFWYCFSLFRPRAKPSNV